ncbi:MAG: sulfurtransferase [Thiohalomonadales bacterium]
MNSHTTGYSLKLFRFFWLVSAFISPFLSAAPAVVGESAGKLLLVEPEWLINHITINDLVILDVRPAVTYNKKHIKNAINIPVAKTFRETKPADQIASIQSIQRLFGEAGIDSSKNVIIYGDGKYIDAARMFWVLEVHGHRRTALLNYGYPGWVRKKYAMSDDVHRLPAKKFYSEVQPSRLTTKFFVRLAIGDKNSIIIDARDSDEYLGIKSSATRVGHIPSAINIPWNKNFIQIGGMLTLQDRASLEHIYRNVARDKLIITYCNRGKQSALTYFVLRKLDRNVSQYDGSWVEWGNDYNLPIETTANTQM